MSIALAAQERAVNAALTAAQRVQTLVFALVGLVGVVAAVLISISSRG